MEQKLRDAVRRMIGARRSADYYVTVFYSLKNHIEFAREAQRAYREADSLLQELGITDNVQRQSIIHEIAAEGV